jgi:hypothetical protein
MSVDHHKAVAAEAERILGTKTAGSSFVRNISDLMITTGLLYWNSQRLACNAIFARKDFRTEGKSGVQ